MKLSELNPQDYEITQEEIPTLSSLGSDAVELPPEQAWGAFDTSTRKDPESNWLTKTMDTVSGALFKNLGGLAATFGSRVAGDTQSLLSGKGFGQNNELQKFATGAEGKMFGEGKSITDNLQRTLGTAGGTILESVGPLAAAEGLGGSLGMKAVKASLGGAGYGAVAAGSEAAQQGKTAQETLAEIGKGAVIGAGVGAIPGAVIGVSKLAQKVLPAIGKKLELTNLRLTPVQKRDLGKKLDQTVQWIDENVPAGTPQNRAEFLDAKYNETENALQSFLENEAKDKIVPKSKVVEQLEALKSTFKNDRDSLAIDKQIDDMVSTLDAKYGDEIPVYDFNQLKRSTFNNAYNQAGTKVRDDVEQSMGNVMKESIESSLSGLKVNGLPIEDFNANYGKLIGARKLLKIAETRPELGLVGKLVASAVGGLSGSALGPVGAAIGAAAGSNVGNIVAGTAVRSAAAKGAKYAAKGAAKLEKFAEKAISGVRKTKSRQ